MTQPEPEVSFADRLFLGSQAVYARIEAGAHPDVDAELMQAHLDASTNDD